MPPRRGRAAGRRNNVNFHQRALDRTRPFSARVQPQEMFGAMHRLASRCISAREAETPLAESTRPSDPRKEPVKQQLSGETLLQLTLSPAPGAPLLTGKAIERLDHFVVGLKTYLV